MGEFKVGDVVEVTFYPGVPRVVAAVTQEHGEHVGEIKERVTFADGGSAWVERCVPYEWKPGDRVVIREDAKPVHGEHGGRRHPPRPDQRGPYTLCEPPWGLGPGMHAVKGWDEGALHEGWFHPAPEEGQGPTRSHAMDAAVKKVDRAFADAKRAQSVRDTRAESKSAGITLNAADAATLKKALREQHGAVFPTFRKPMQWLSEPIPFACDTRIEPEEPEMDACDTCQGEGETMVMVCYGGPPSERMGECPDCDGTGQQPVDPLDEPMPVVDAAHPEPCVRIRERVRSELPPGMRGAKVGTRCEVDGVEFVVVDDVEPTTRVPSRRISHPLRVHSKRMESQQPSAAAASGFRSGRNYGMKLHCDDDDFGLAFADGVEVR